MKITLGQFRSLITEVLAEMLPPKESIERALQSAKGDKEAGAKLMSTLDRKFPVSSKLLLQSLSRAFMAWQADKVAWHSVSGALDRLYDSVNQQKRKPSYSRGTFAA